MKFNKWIFALTVGLIIVLGARGGSAKELDIGIKDGRLKPCPDTPNCVSTFENNKAHGIEPLKYEGSQVAAMSKLFEVINSLPRTVIISQTDNYLYVTFTSRIFRFVDDVEFLFDDSHKIIHFRSASRVGYSDLLANRNRMEEIRKRFQS